MVAERLNPYRDPKPFNRVRIGGRLIKAILTKYNGIKIEDEWKDQKSKEANGSTNVFAGTKGLKAIELTFNAPNAEMFDDLYEIFQVLAPVPGLGGGSVSSTTKKPTGYVGSPSAADASSSSSDSKDSTKDTAGPRPPTLPIENAVLAFVGVFAVARKSWEGPLPSEGNSWEVTIGLIQDKPPTPAGAGAMAPAKSLGSQYATAGVTDPQATADEAKKKADGAAAGT